MANRYVQRFADEGGTLGAALTNSGTTITFTTAPGFATLGTDEYIRITLDVDETENGPEVVYLTSYTSGAVTGTIERAKEGTTGVAHSLGEDWDHGPTNYDFDEKIEANNGGRETLDTNSNSGASPSIDLIDGNVHDVTLTANATFTFTGAESGKGVSFTLILRQDGTGGRTVTWPASVKWAAGTAPTLSSAASAIDILVFQTVDGGTTWFGSLAGAGYA